MDTGSIHLGSLLILLGISQWPHTSVCPVLTFQFNCHEESSHVCTVKNYDPRKEGRYVLRYVSPGIRGMHFLGLQTTVLDDYLLSALPPSITDVMLTESAAIEAMIVSTNLAITRIEVVDSGLREADFAANGYIETLSIVASDLHRIPASVGNLMNLVQLKIQFSPIKELRMTTFSGNQNLKILDLRHNNITSIIRTDSPECLRSLQELLLGWNKLKRIGWDEFSPLCQLQIIDLSNNGIEVVTGRFTNTGICAILLWENRLQTLDMCQWNVLPNIDSIILLGNQLANVPECLEKLPNVQSVNFARNNLSRVSMASFSLLHNLDSLNFIGNPIISFTINGKIPPLLESIYVDYSVAENLRNSSLPAGMNKLFKTL